MSVMTMDRGDCSGKLIEGHGLICPQCDQPFRLIERTPNGQRICPAGHTYHAEGLMWIKEGARR